MRRLLNRRSLVAVFIFLVGAGLAAAFLSVRRMRQHQDEQFTSSCANHAIQLKLDVMVFSQKAEYFPMESDMRKAFQKISNEESVDWLTSAGSACPESFNRDRAIGYVFVADGLSTKGASDHSALLFFCPADNHQRSSEHCHALMGGGELVCVTSNSKMMSLLQQELGRATSGLVPYSTNALAQMEHQLRRREHYERKRH